MLTSNPCFSPDDRSQLRSAFLSLIPYSDEVAARLYGPLGVSEPETMEEAIRQLAAVIDALEDPAAFERACQSFRAWHRELGIASMKQEGFGCLFGQALSSFPGPLSADEVELLVRLWFAVAASPTE